MAQVGSYNSDDYTLVTSVERSTDGEWIVSATYTELDGCDSHGMTTQEARESLEEAFVLYASHAIEHGLELPPPNSHVQSIHLYPLHCPSYLRV
jgi:predicted RNase H-like HicB family nuclease